MSHQSTTEPRRVGVLMGGLSTERAVSLKSGKAVAAALRARGHAVVEIDVGPDLPARLVAERVDVAWIALHGAFGEDGCVQGMLEIMRIPYTGSAAAASAMAMDKVATKKLLQGTDVRLIPDRIWRAGQPIPDDLDYPVFAKTPKGGSTIGAYRCDDRISLKQALAECTRFDDEVLIEQLVAGEEITVAVLDGRALPVVAIHPVEGFFDFEAKYTEGRTEYLVPAPISEQAALDAQEQARVAFSRMGLSGVARADFIIDERGVPWFLEVNTIPGMTATSLSPMAAGATGMSFEDLVEALLVGARLHLQPATQASVAQPGAAPHRSPLPEAPSSAHSS